MPRSNGHPLFFWRETEAEGGFLSPWYPSQFSENGHTYESVGHFVMASKARLFNDEGTLKKILAATDANKHRTLGSKVKGFDEEVWKSQSYLFAVQANRLKFTQGTAKSDLCDRLLKTGNRELIDASPHDRIWGIGIKASEAKKKDASRYQWGENQFGKALMETRTSIRSQADPASKFDTPGNGLSIEW
ncbi:DUF1768-domain-containing protein [Cadophora sp. DSE1049]|nr:DUF1768-domain-containing protein [Cadophora sp. DSE1049]